MLHNNGGVTDRVGGYDVTFSAPKSCSILYALADDNLRAQIENAQAQAVHAAIMFLERNALPANYVPVAPIIVGHPESAPPPVPRKEPEIRWIGS